MPVTARLSKRFYDRLGDDVANELVNWFNSVDFTYRSELKELNTQNIALFDAKLDKRVAECETRLLRWMFAFWATNMLALAGLALAVLRAR